ncbi:MAG TPA: PilZ domain-containing protein [Terracidiphilus sp.]|nr:PilZ domain-containing protein [Terracidiphilus sp.]
MDTRVFCVYNLARGVFLSSKVTAVDGVNEPLKILKVLVGGLGLDTVSGLWICPLSAIPAVPRLFPFDLLYLDRDQRVVESAEIVPGAEFPPYRREVASALVLARQTVESTQTGRGDRLIIGVEEEIEREIAAADASDLEPIVSNGRPSGHALFGKNGKVKGTALSAVLAEPFSSVVTRPSEGAVSGTELAMKPPVNQPAVEQAVKEFESEGGISASRTIETDGVEPEVVSEAIAKEDAELARLVPDAAGISAEIAEKPIRSTSSKSSEGASSDEAKDSIPGERQAKSIPEPIVESGSKSVVNGQQGGFEDLFSNWVDAPSSSMAWIPRNPRPGSAPPTPPAPDIVASTPPDKNSSGGEPASKAPDAFPSQPIPEPETAVAAVSRETAPQNEKPRESAAAPANTPTPVQAPIPTRTALPQSPPATTFTVANYGVWRVSMPTAVSPLGAVQSPDQTRPAAPVADNSSNVKEKSAEERPTPVTKAADSSTEGQALSGASRFAGATGLSRESVRAQAAAKAQEPLETAKDKAVVPPGESTQESAAYSKSTTRELMESSRAAESSIVANSEKKPVIEAANSIRERLPVKAGEKAERPVPAERDAAVHDKVKTPQPEGPAANAGVSAQSAAAAPKQVRVVSKAIVTAKSAAPKALPKPSTARTEANGKPQTGPPSLGLRFKRWLNPVTPVASDRRRAHRRYVPGMVAHYYTGGSPKPHDVADISMTGFYLLTEDRWMPETMIQMTLQKPCAKGERKQSIVVLSRIVRRGSDGVAAQFVMPEDLNPQSHDVQPSQATDRFSLARFL